MEKYKIKRNPKKLSDEQIDSHKDFSKLLSNQQKLHRYKDGTRPMYRNIGFMCMMVVIGIVLLMLVLDHSEESSSIAAMETLPVVKADSGLQLPIDQNQEPLPESNTTAASEKTVSADKPAKIVASSIVYERFKVIPEKGAVLYTQSGVRIFVPVDAFSDVSHVIVKKEITLKYRAISNLKEAGVKTIPSTTPFQSFELLAVESDKNTPVLFSKTIVLELVAPIRQGQGTLSFYTVEKDKWESVGTETSAYRFTLQSNDTQFPELALLRQMAWEMPQEMNLANVSYIFNRSWKGFTYKTTGKKESSVKNTNSSVNILTDVAPILGDGKEDLELKEAFFTVYNYSIGKNTDLESQKRAIQTINSWKNSSEGNEYQKWLKSEEFENQLYTSAKVSKLSVKQAGIHVISYASLAQSKPNKTKRVLTLEKYPEKTQQYLNDGNQN